MKRTSLAKDNLLVPGIQLETFENASGFTVTGTGATISDNTDWFTQGAKSMRITATSGVVAVVKRTAAIDTKLMRSHSGNIEFDLNIETDLDTTYADFNLTFINASRTKYVTRSFKDPYSMNLKNGINHISAPMTPINDYAMYTIGGIGEFDNYDVLELRLTPKAGKTCIVSVDNLSMGAVYRPTLVVGFDDGYSSVYDVAYPILSALGIVATVYVIPTLVGTTGFMDLAQLHLLHDAGWCIANHTYNHSVMTGLSLAEQKTQIHTCNTWLIDNGFYSGVGHVAFPTGVYNADTVTALKELSQKTGRATTGSGGSYADRGYMYNPIPRDCTSTELCSVYTLTTKTLSGNDEPTMQKYIDYCQQNRTPLILYIHKVGAFSGDGMYCDTTAFANLMSSVKARKLQTLTIDQYYNQINGLRLV